MSCIINSRKQNLLYSREKMRRRSAKPNTQRGRGCDRRPLVFDLVPHQPTDGVSGRTRFWDEGRDSGLQRWVGGTRILLWHMDTSGQVDTCHSQQPGRAVSGTGTWIHHVSTCRRHHHPHHHQAAAPLFFGRPLSWPACPPRRLLAVLCA